MATNRVSATISDKDRKEILDAIKTLRDKLPFLIDLTPQERRSLPKLGDKSIAFVQKALELSQQDANFLPRDFDIEEMGKDLELFTSLSAILINLSKLVEQLEDTTLAAGSEAYLAALLVYSYAKTGGAAISGLEAVADELGQRFIRRSRSTKNNPLPTNQ